MCFKAIFNYFGTIPIIRENKVLAQFHTSKFLSQNVVKKEVVQEKVPFTEPTVERQGVDARLVVNRLELRIERLSLGELTIPRPGHPGDEEPGALAR